MATTPPPPPAWPDRAEAGVAGEPIGPPAGFWARFLAYLIDFFAVMAAMLLVIGAVALVVGVGSVATLDEHEHAGLAALGAFLAIAAYVLFAWLYEALLTSGPRGATLGKRALGLRILRADGERLSFGRATARFFLKALITPLVPFAIGYLLAAFTSRKRALHDFMADTVVIESN